MSWLLLFILLLCVCSTVKGYCRDYPFRTLSNGGCERCPDSLCGPLGAGECDTKPWALFDKEKFCWYAKGSTASKENNCDNCGAQKNGCNAKNMFPWFCLRDTLAGHKFDEFEDEKLRSEFYVGRRHCDVGNPLYCSINAPTVIAITVFEVIYGADNMKGYDINNLRRRRRLRRLIELCEEEKFWQGKVDYFSFSLQTFIDNTGYIEGEAIIINTCHPQYPSNLQLEVKIRNQGFNNTNNTSFYPNDPEQDGYLIIKHELYPSYSNVSCKIYEWVPFPSSLGYSDMNYVQIESADPEIADYFYQFSVERPSDECASCHLQQEQCFTEGQFAGPCTSSAYCDSKKPLDILFLLDEGISRDEYELHVVNEFVKEIIEHHINDISYVSVIQFANKKADFKELIGWTSMATGKQNILDAVDLDPKARGRAHTGYSISRALTTFECNNNRSNVLVVLTEGEAKNTVCPDVKDELNQWSNMSNFDIVVITITTQYKQSKQHSSSSSSSSSSSTGTDYNCLYPNPSTNAFHVESIDTESFAQIIPGIKKKTCRKEPPPGTPPPTDAPVEGPANENAACEVTVFCYDNPPNPLNIPWWDEYRATLDNDYTVGQIGDILYWELNITELINDGSYQYGDIITVNTNYAENAGLDLEVRAYNEDFGVYPNRKINKHNYFDTINVAGFDGWYQWVPYNTSEINYLSFTAIDANLTSDFKFKIWSTTAKINKDCIQDTICKQPRSYQFDTCNITSEFAYTG